MFLDSGTCFGFCEVFWILERVLDSWTCFWILGSVLDSGTCFWILGSVLDSILGRVLDILYLGFRIPEKDD